ncbi:MAG: hypothetical protein QXV95_00015 [Sulfolobales archaeon]
MNYADLNALRSARVFPQDLVGESSSALLNLLLDLQLLETSLLYICKAVYRESPPMSQVGGLSLRDRCRVYTQISI